MGTLKCAYCKKGYKATFDTNENYVTIYLFLYSLNTIKKISQYIYNESSDDRWIPFKDFFMTFFLNDPLI